MSGLLDDLEPATVSAVNPPKLPAAPPAPKSLLDDLEPINLAPRAASGALESIQAGFQGSAPGLAWRRKLPDLVINPEHAAWWERALSGMTHVGAELPLMIGGAIAGAPAGAALGTAVAPGVGTAVGSLLGAGAGMGAIPAAIRQTLIEAYKSGDVMTAADFWNSVREVAKTTATEAGINAAAMGAGAVAGRVLGKAIAPSIGQSISVPTAIRSIEAADIATQIAAMPTIPAILQGRLPDAQEFVDAAILIGGLKAAHVTASNITSVFLKTGKTPAEQVADVQKGRVPADQFTGPPEPPVNPEVLKGLLKARLDAITMKLKGTPDKTVQGPDGKPITIPGQLIQFVSREERAERDWLAANIDNADALAQRYTVRRQQQAEEDQYVPPSRAEMLKVQENLFTETARLDEMAAKAEASPLSDPERLEMNALKARVLDLENQLRAGAPELSRTPTYTADQFVEARKQADTRLAELTTKAETEALTDTERAERVFLSNSLDRPTALAKHFGFEPILTERPTPQAIDASAQRIHDDVLRQLKDADEARKTAGLEPLGDDHAQAVAALVRARVRTRAERLGVLPESLYAERPVKIEDVNKLQGEPTKFELSDEWQVVPEGTVLPSGVQTRSSFVTGVTEARRMPGADSPIPQPSGEFSAPEVDLFGEPIQPPPMESQNQVATVEPAMVPVSGLTLSKDVPQFKAGANAKGVVEPLGGAWDPTGVGPIQIWQRLNGAMEVISGRHRLDKAQREGVDQIWAQVHKESEGFTRDMAAALDAMLNIRDGQGSVADYAQFFKAAGLTKDAAERAGLLARGKGKSGFAIARDASPDLLATHRAGNLSDEAALVISSTAPGSERLQALGIAAVQEGKTLLYASNLMRSVDMMAAERMMAGEQGDIFGFDDSALKEASAMAKKASSKQRAISEQIAAVSGASKRPELARKMGVNVEDPAAVQAKILELKQEQYLWDNWPLYPELVKQLRGEVMKQRAVPDITSAEFQRWFADSKVVDDAGKPLIVYHGTAGDFNEFRTDFIGQNFGDKGGFYFTNNTAHRAWQTSKERGVDEDMSGAGAYAKASARNTGGNANIIPAYVSLKNPKIIREDTEGRGVLSLIESRTEYADHALADAISEGHDGIIAIDTGFKMSNGQFETVVVAARPEQIKSAIGNRGTFDPTDPNILHQPETPAEATARDQEAVAEALRNETVKPKLKKNEEQWYHGTRENIADFSRGGEVYLTDRPIEAGGYALGGHLGGTGTEQPRVYSIAAKKGKTLNIDDMINEEIMNGAGEIEVVLEAGIAKAKAEGARYVEYQHPSFEGDTEQNVRISLYPAEDLRITHQPKDNLGGVLFQDQIRDRWYKSALGEAINTANIKSAPVKGWQDFLKGQVAKGGVKADEIKWSGVEDWLKLQEGKVTKEQVADYLASNGVKVEEVMLGADRGGVTEAEHQAAFNAASELGAEDRRLWRIIDESIQPQRGVDRANLPWWGREMAGMSGPDIAAQAEAKARGIGLNDQQIQMLKEWGDVSNRRSEADAHANELGTQLKTDGTKFGIYQLPGGENYRELKLILPGGEFVSSHFPEDKGLLAHIRFNERTDAEGKKVLFVEEIQSDWAQKGKKEGFALTASENVEVQALLEKAAEAGGIQNLTKEEQARGHELGARLTRSSVPAAPFVGKTDAWVSLAMKRMIRYAAENGFDKVAWTRGEQQVERYSSALRKAVDVIEWKKTPDGVQIVGYKGGPSDLTRIQIDRMQGLESLDRPLTPDELRELQGYRGRKTKVVDTTEKEDNLSDAIGKAMADQIRNDPNQTGTIEGDQITVSDTGMAGFYDKIVPKVAKEVLKKLGGGKVTETEIELPVKQLDRLEIAPIEGPPQFRRASADDLMGMDGLEDFPNGDAPLITDARIKINDVEQDVLITVDPQGVHVLGENFELSRPLPRNTEISAARAAEYMRLTGWENPAFWASMELLTGELPGQGKTKTIQPAFEITPAMREGAMAGQPLFQKQTDQLHRGSYDIAENLVTTLQGADKSTVVHELGHSWLEEMKADAARPDAPASIKADWETLRKELAIGENGEISRTSHEQFARSVERYLAEGEAPSRELQSVFARFREWLLDIYKSVMNLNVEINPELRQVLDRMLATDEEIAAARDLGVPRAYVPEAAAAAVEAMVPTTQPKAARRQINPGLIAEKAAIEGHADELPPGAGEAPNNIHVNYEYMDSPLKVKLALQKIAEVDQENIQKHRGGKEGVESWQQEQATMEAALLDTLGGGPDKLGVLRGGETDTVKINHRLRAMNQLMKGAVAFSEAKRDAILAAGHDATILQQLEYLGSIERVRMLQAEFLGERAAVARAMNSLKDSSEGSGEIGRMLEAIGIGNDGTMFQSNRTPAEEQAYLKAKLDEILQNYKGKSVLDIAKLHKEIGTLKGTFKLAKEVSQATRWEQIVEGWRAGLLSGPVTHTTNLLGTEAFHVMRPAVDALASIIGMARGASPGMGESDRASMSEAVARLTGMLGGVQDGIKVAIAEFKADEATGKTEAYRTAIPGQAGRIIRTPLRLMGAEDALVTTMYTRGEIRTLAIRQAFDEDLNPSTREFAERVAYLQDNPTPEMQVAAETAATRMTFNAPLGEKGVALQGFVNKWNLQWMIPFIRTPINIAKELLRMSPFAPAIGEWRQAFAKGGVERDRALAEMALGSGIMAITMAYAFSNDDKGRQRLTGSGGPDPGKNRGKAGVWQPYSILIGDTYYEYARIQPTGTLMGMAADMAAVWDHMTDEEKDKVPKMLSAAFAQAITNQTFLQGIANFVNALSDPTRFGPRFLQSMAGSLVPNIIGQPTTMADPVVREVNSALEAIQARIPGMRQDLLPKRDWLGEPVQTKERLGVVLPVREQQISDDKVRQEAARLDISMAAAPKKTHIGKGTGKLGDVELTPQERDAFEKIGGEFAHGILQNIVNAPGYDQMPDMVKRKVFSNVLTAAHRVAAVQALPMEKRIAYLQEITEKVVQELTPGDAP